MNFEALKGKRKLVYLLSNGGWEEGDGYISESAYGDEFFHFKDEDGEYDVLISALAYLEDSEQEEEEPVEEIKNKYASRSVDEIPPRKKKGWF